MNLKPHQAAALGLPSPFVGDLLRNIADSDAEDRSLLLTMAFDALQRSPGEYSCMDTPTGQMFVMSREAVTNYLRRSGFEDWYRSTWLSLSPAGEVVGDVPMSKHGPQSEYSINALVGSTLRQACSAGVAKYAARGDTEYFGFTGVGLVDFFQLARGTAHASSDWPAPAPITAETVNVPDLLRSAERHSTSATSRNVP